MWRISILSLGKKKSQTRQTEFYIPKPWAVSLGCASSSFPFPLQNNSLFIDIGCFWLIFHLISHVLKYLSCRNTASCIPPSDFLLEISQSQINLVAGKPALPAWRDGWLMSVLLPAPQTWQPESLSSIHHSPLSSCLPAPLTNSQPMCAWAARAVRQPRGTAVTCRVPVTLGCCPAELRDSTATLHTIPSLGLLLQVKDTSEFGSSCTSRHYHYHVVN